MSKPEFLPDGKRYVDEGPVLPHERAMIGRLYSGSPSNGGHPDRDIALAVVFMSAFGVPKAAMSRVLGVPVSVLAKFYKEELDKGLDLNLGVLSRRMMEIVADAKDETSLRAILAMLDRVHGKSPNAKVTADGELVIRWQSPDEGG